MGIKTWWRRRTNNHAVIRAIQWHVERSLDHQRQADAAWDCGDKITAAWHGSESTAFWRRAMDLEDDRRRLYG